MKAVVAQVTETKNGNAERRNSRGVAALNAPGHAMPVVAQRQSSGGHGAVMRSAQQVTTLRPRYEDV